MRSSRILVTSRAGTGRSHFANGRKTAQVGEGRCYRFTTKQRDDCGLVLKNIQGMVQRQCGVFWSERPIDGGLRLRSLPTIAGAAP
jgi:hypothetical protein